MPINCNLKTLSDNQKSDVQLAKKLLDNLNSFKPSHVNNITLEYDGERFRVVQPGFVHKFLTDDIHLALKQELNKHKNFILEYLRGQFESYDRNLKSGSITENEKIILNAIMKYYKNYPIYSDDSGFSDFLDMLDKSVQTKLAEF